MITVVISDDKEGTENLRQLDLTGKTKLDREAARAACDYAGIEGAFVWPTDARGRMLRHMAYRVYANTIRKYTFN